MKHKVGVGERQESRFPLHHHFGVVLCERDLSCRCHHLSLLFLRWPERLLAFSMWGGEPRMPDLHRKKIVLLQMPTVPLLRNTGKVRSPKANELFPLTSTQWTAERADFPRLFLLPRVPCPHLNYFTTFKTQFKHHMKRKATSQVFCLIWSCIITICVSEDHTRGWQLPIRLAPLRARTTLLWVPLSGTSAPSSLHTAWEIALV